MPWHLTSPVDEEGRIRHDLHEPPGPNPTDGFGIPRAFHDDEGYQSFDGHFVIQALLVTDTHDAQRVGVTDSGGLVPIQEGRQGPQASLFS